MLLTLSSDMSSINTKTTFYERNKEAQKCKMLAYYYSNQDAIKARYKALPEDVKEQRRQRTREWRKLNKAKKLQSDKQWKRNHPEAWRKTRIGKNLRDRIKSFLLKGHSPLPCAELVGCSRTFLLQWIEDQFKRGMNWSNYGKRWHIDHIVPCAAFDLSDVEQQKKCSHYTNLQPSWVEDNMRKQDKIMPNTQPELIMSMGV